MAKSSHAENRDAPVHLESSLGASGFSTCLSVQVRHGANGKLQTGGKERWSRPKQLPALSKQTFPFTFTPKDHRTDIQTTTMPLPRPPPVTSASATTLTSSHDAQALAPLIASTFTSPSIAFWLNGQPTILTSPNPQWTLLDYLRSRPNLRGTKLGCGEGGCGACTVVMQVGQREPHAKRRIRHLSINACLFPIIGCDGKHIITIEGIGSVANPHPLQERVAKMHGSQCGFCTPGIVMSLYALVRNAWDPEAGLFRLTERDVELQGALDGNLCRCTGYKTILEAAKTFVTEDVKARLDSSADTDGNPEKGDEMNGSLNHTSLPSCGRPGGCCRDAKPAASPSTESLQELNSNSSRKTSDSQDSGSSPESSLSSMDEHTKDDPPTKPNTNDFKTYVPGTELIYPPALWNHQPRAICYGDENTLWFRPTTLLELLQLKSAFPPAKLVSGSSELTIEQRIKGAEWSVMVYVGDVPSLRGSNLPGFSQQQGEEEHEFKNDLTLFANTPLTEVEQICQEGYHQLGPRGMVLEALRRQLRYFGGRQIRNVATLAGNISTASPISDVLPVLMAVNANVTIARLGQRNRETNFTTVLINDFIKGYRRTSLTDDMQDGVVTAIVIPLAPTGLSGKEVVKAYKQSKRKEDDIAIVSSCFRVRLDEKGCVDQATFAYGGMAPTVITVPKTQALLIGSQWADQSTLDAAIESLHAELYLPYDVPGGMAQYRTTLACSLFLRFWYESLPDIGLEAHNNGAHISEIERGLSHGVRDIQTLPSNLEKSTSSSIGKPVPHLSALAQTTGQAEYVDDIPPQHNELFGGLVLCRNANGRILSVDWTSALSMPGVVGYIDRHSLSSPDINMWGSQRHDEPLFAEDTILSHGQVIGMVLADSQLTARTAARRVKVNCEAKPAIITIDDAIKAGSFFDYGRELRKGDTAVAGDFSSVLAGCDRVFEGTTRIGGQEQFYLETNAALAVPKSEDGQIDVWSSTQNT